MVAIDKTIFDVDENYSAFPKYEFLERRGWVGLIREGRLRGDAPLHFASACHKFGLSTASCGDLNDPPQLLFETSLDVESVKSIHQRFYAPSFALVENQGRFLLVSDNDYYWALFGDRPFVEASFPIPWQQVLDEFDSDIAPYEADRSPHESRLWKNFSAYARICRATFATEI